MMPTINDLKARTIPERCAGSYAHSYYDTWGCHVCGSRYHCSHCGAGTGMYGHYMHIEGFQGHWCELAKERDVK